MENIQTAAPERTNNETVGFWTYFGLSALFTLPVVGLIAAIVFAFAPKNKSIKNYARVMMTWGIVGLLICGLLAGAAIMAIRTAMGIIGTEFPFDPTSPAFSERIQDMLSQIPKDQLDDLMERYRNGEFDDLIERFQRGEFGDPDDLINRFEKGEFGDLSDLIDQLPTEDGGTTNDGGATGDGNAIPDDGGAPANGG